MICDVRNAYPNNIVIDPDVSSENQLYFQFYGTYSIGADFRIYYADTMEQLTRDDGTPIYWYDRKPIGYYNGDTIDCRFNQGFLKQNNNYVWQARCYQDVDMEKGNYPSVILSNGLIQEQNWITTQIKTAVTAANNQDGIIKIETGLSVTIPSYIYIEEKNYWYLVKKYNSSTGETTLSKPIIETGSSETIPTGKEIIISKYRTTDKPDLTKKYICIEPNNNNIPVLERDFKYWKTLDRENETEQSYTTYIKINNEYYAVAGYKKTSGIIYLADQSDIEFDKGTPYEIYCNFTKSPYFYFSTKPLPQITPLLEYVDESLKCTANITNQYYDIKYYFWQIYENGTLIEQSENIYSSELKYYGRIFQANKTYTAKITVVTQDNRQHTGKTSGVTISDLAEKGVKNLSVRFNKAYNSVHITAMVNLNSGHNTSIAIIRKETESNIYKYLSVLKYAKSNNSQTHISYIDTSCSIDKEYTYYVIPRTSSGVYLGDSANISTQSGDWSVSFLRRAKSVLPSLAITDNRDYYKYMYGDVAFNLVKTFLIGTNVQIDTISHNIGNEIKTTYSTYPSGNYGENDYDSFSLSFVLADIDCDSETFLFKQSDFEIWKEMMKEDYSVLIKDPKGNVWVGEIISHSYSVDYNSLDMPYTITIEFNQLYDNNKVKIS